MVTNLLRDAFAKTSDEFTVKSPMAITRSVGPTAKTYKLLQNITVIDYSISLFSGFLFNRGDHD